MVEDYKVYDNCLAHEIMFGDRIIYKNDHVEIHKIIDDGPLIELVGYSYDNDDEVNIVVDPYDRLDLWLIE